MSDRRVTERRELIVAAARRVFTTHGYDGTTIGGLATELGISKAAIGYYFPTKDTFLDEFVTPFLDDLEAAIETAEGPAAVLSGYLATLTRHHDIAVWMDTDPVLQSHAVHGARLTSINARVIAIVTGGSRRSQDRIRALTALGAVWRPVRELPTDDLRTYHDAIVDAALARQAVP